MSRLLWPLQLIYRALNRVRRALYRKGIFQAKELPRPVISVGNIAMGGAGKTPAVIALARYLSSKGLRVAVLTRGYGRDSSATGMIDSLDAGRWGDEPVLIQKSVENVDVIVGKNRYKNAISYLETISCDVFVLDDGFQHLQIRRDLDLVIDLPHARLLREGRSALRHAGLVVPRRLALRIPDALRNLPLFAFSGLADNEQFFASLRQAGLLLAGTRSFPDHHRYRDEDLRSIAEAATAAGAQRIVTTAKDAVKIGREDIVAVEAEFVFDPQVLQMIDERVRDER